MKITQAPTSIEQHPDTTSEPIKRAKTYQDRYPYDGRPVSETNQNLESLFRMRPVMHGVLYRGGVFHTEGSREEIPLSPESLNDLCEEGFGNAVNVEWDGFYSSDQPFAAYDNMHFNKDTGTVEVSCTSRLDNAPNTLIYTHITPEEKKYRDFLEIVQDATKPNGKPVFVHCLHGLHRAGLMSTISLIQFCDLDNTPHIDGNGNIQTDPFGAVLSDASLYWFNNTDTTLYDPRDQNSEHYHPKSFRWTNDKMTLINSFERFLDLTITPAEKQAMCLNPDPIDPNNPEHF